MVRAVCGAYPEPVLLGGCRPPDGRGVCGLSRWGTVRCRTWSGGPRRRSQRCGSSTGARGRMFNAARRTGARPAVSRRPVRASSQPVTSAAVITSITSSSPLSHASRRTASQLARTVGSASSTVRSPSTARHRRQRLRPPQPVVGPGETRRQRPVRQESLRAEELEPGDRHRLGAVGRPVTVGGHHSRVGTGAGQQPPAGVAGHGVGQQDVELGDVGHPADQHPEPGPRGGVDDPHHLVVGHGERLGDLPGLRVVGGQVRGGLGQPRHCAGGVPGVGPGGQDR